MSITRRNFSKLTGSLFAIGLAGLPKLASAKSQNAEVVKNIISLEKQLSARMGVAILDTATGRQWTHRANERFPLCSTFKLLACGAVLARVDAGKEDLNRRIHFNASELVTWSPVTEKFVGDTGMSLAEICEAALTHSDNTAANIILQSLGGPETVTQFARNLGDNMSRLDRHETELNEATPGDARDTTTPSAMANNMHALVLGNKLSAQSRAQLKTWLLANKTGDAKIRAGLPTDWIVGDKTGSGGYGSVNDVAIIFPPNRKPLIASIYITETKASFDDCNAAMAEVARALVTALTNKT
jgi:beta-lactamase class A